MRPTSHVATSDHCKTMGTINPELMRMLTDCRSLPVRRNCLVAVFITARDRAPTRKVTAYKMLCCNFCTVHSSSTCTINNIRSAACKETMPHPNIFVWSLLWFGLVSGRLIVRLAVTVMGSSLPNSSAWRMILRQGL